MSHLVITFCVAIALAGSAAAAPYEEAAQTTGARVLPAEVQHGDGWAVADPVEADGVNYLFTLETQFGPIHADGEIVLHQRIVEVRALKVLEEESNTEEFAVAFAKAGAMPLYLLKDVVTKPKETASGFGRGIWKGIRKAVGWIGGDRRERAETEDSAFEEAIGFNRRKREISAQLDVDPYTDNDLLQGELNRVAWAGFAGGLGPKLVVAVIATPAATVTYRATSITQGPRKLVQGMSGGDLHRTNRELLREQGLDPEQIEKFLDNPELSPTVKTAITLYLLGLENAEGRQHIIDRAIEISDGDQGVRFALDGAVTSGYHQSVEPVESVVRLGDELAVATRNGKLVAVRAADKLMWTPTTAELARAMAQKAQQDQQIGSVELRITGEASARARTELAALDIDLHEDAFEDLTEAFIETPDDAGEELAERVEEL